MNMTFGPPVSDESVLMRWMAVELGKINDGVVADRRRLSDLVRELPPASITRGGREYTLNKGIVAFHPPIFSSFKVFHVILKRSWGLRLRLTPAAMASPTMR